MSELNKPVRIRDIAQRLGVSEVTVSLALRNNPRISAGRRKQVQDMATEMGYRPNAMASALAQSKWSSVHPTFQAAIAWINFWPSPAALRAWKEFDLYWKGAAAEAERSGYRLEEFLCDARVTSTRLEQILLTRNIRGLLLPPAPADRPPDWGAFAWRNFSVVRFGYSMASPPAHLVTSNQLTDGLIAYESMWARGYRRIGLISGTISRTRFSAGFVLGQMKFTQGRLIPPLVIENRDTPADMARLASWLKREKPDAILTDLFVLPDLLKRQGLLVPRDIGLAALSVLDGCADAGIYQNSEEIGKVAVQLLISLLHHNETGVPEICREVLIEGRWVDGTSLPVRKPAAG